MRLKRRVIIWTAIAIAMLACGSKPNLPGVTMLYAQVGSTRTLQWTADPAASIYTVQLDGVTIGNPTTSSQAFTVPANGAHTFTVTATNTPSGQTATVTYPIVVGQPAVPSGFVIK
jgi:LEA14-like dessication related protein